MQHMHPTRYDYTAYKEWREIDDERQKEALRKFYARNSAPHYSPAIRIWWCRLPLYKRCGYIGCACMVGAFLLTVAAIQVADRLWP